MSGIIAVVAPSGERPEAQELRAMLSALSSRGTEPWAISRGFAVLGGTRFPGEVPGDWYSSGVAPTSAAAAADATLYYRNDLCRRLEAAGVRVERSGSVEEIILAAYYAWGERLAERLEGDFAFAVHDAARDILVCARDFCGRRPLYYAVIGGGIAVASTPGALLAHPRVRHDLDLSVVAATAAGLFALKEETAYQAVRVVPPGHTLVWRGGSIRIEPHWRPPQIEERRTVPGHDFEAGAEELRELLAAAVAERLDGSHPTAVWLSGGYDSTAVWGSGHHALSRGSPGSLRAVSVSYPVDDPGCEDHYIEAATRFWDSNPRWLDIRRIPLLTDPAGSAAGRDEPFAHVFEGWNRALARGAAESGCRVALDGVGGDQLFQLSPVTLAELFRTGNWLGLRREWQEKRMRGWRNLARWAILPHLSRRGLDLLGVLRAGRPIRGYLERPVPPWIRPEFLEANGVLEREAEHTPGRGGLGPAAYETMWYLTHPFGGRILSCVSEIALQEGVELRSPLLDGRVVAFALSRPWSERSQGAESKRLLRRAMRGLLPEEVLAGRAYRTGTTSRYLVESIRAAGEGLVREPFCNSRLAELGIIDEAALMESWRTFVRRPDENVAVALLFSLHAELWLRAREQRSGGIGVPPILVGRLGGIAPTNRHPWEDANTVEDSWT